MYPLEGSDLSRFDDRRSIKIILHHHCRSESGLKMEAKRVTVVITLAWSALMTCEPYEA